MSPWLRRFSLRCSVTPAYAFGKATDKQAKFFQPNNNGTQLLLSGSTARDMYVAAAAGFVRVRDDARAPRRTGSLHPTHQCKRRP